MQVSDEVINNVAKAIAKSNQYAINKEWKNIGKAQRNRYRSLANAAIQAILPHIRNEVLEEAALIVDSRLKLLGDIKDGLKSGQPLNYYIVTEAKWLENKECATAIRNLKEVPNSQS